jgi:2-methylcitrate dehydratase PrpD
MARIHLRADPALDAQYPDKRGATARLVFMDGAVLEGRIDNARGEPEAPLSRAEIEAKFLLLTRARLGPVAEEVRDLVMAVEDLEELSALTRPLAGRGGVKGAPMRRRAG